MEGLDLGVLGMLQLLDDRDEYLVALDVLSTLLLDSDLVEMMDILQSLS